MEARRTVCISLLISFVYVFEPVNCDKILGFFPMTSKSHLNMFNPLFRELASRGHKITTVTTMKPNLQIPNIIEMVVPEMMSVFRIEDMKRIFSDASESSLSRLFSLTDPFIELCKITLDSSVIHDLVNKGQVYDLVLVSGYANECAVQLAPLLAKHVVMISASPVVFMLTFPYTSYPSFVPERSYYIPPHMNFVHRLQNAVGVFIGKKIFQWIQWKGEALVFESFPNAPTMAEAQNKISLLLANIDPILSVPQPTTPRIIPVGGMQIGQPKPLAKGFQDFVENAGNDGFIVFTLGSITPSELMPKNIQEAFLSAFSRLKQKVIWRYNGEIENVPSNVMISPWLPQQDLLAHPNARVFITHCGLLGLQEAIHFGVPVIGIPLYGDQFGNIALMEAYGLGEQFGPLLSLTADEIYETLNKVLQNKKYKENMKKYSSIMRDHLVSPVDRAVYWVEYVLRHNGAHHLRGLGDDLGFIEYYLLDVIGVLLLTFGAIFWLLKVTVTFPFRYFKRERPVSNIKKKN